MAIDWKLMIDLRERQRTTASDLVQRQRQVVAESEAEVQAARMRLVQQQDSKAALWNGISNAKACTIDEMQRASAWSRALDGKVAEAAQAVHQALVVAQEKHAVLEQRRRELRAAMAELEKAKEMQQRLLTGQRRAAEARADEVVDEWAANQWSMNPPERA